MRQRIGTRRGDVGIGRKIRRRVEIDGRVAPFVPAELIVVVERVDVRCRHVGVGREISAHVEQRVRIAALPPAKGLEVRERIDARGRNVRIVLQVVDVVEAVPGDEFAGREGLAQFARSEQQEVFERIDVRGLLVPTIDNLPPVTVEPPA